MMTHTAAKLLADQLATERFAIGDPRSSVYQLGFKDLIISRATGTPMPRVYSAGSVQFDAYCAGIADGRMHWTDYLQRERIAA